MPRLEDAISVRAKANKHQGYRLSYVRDCEKFCDLSFSLLRSVFPSLYLSSLFSLCELPICSIRENPPRSIVVFVEKLRNIETNLKKGYEVMRMWMYRVFHRRIFWEIKEKIRHRYYTIVFENFNKQSMYTLKYYISFSILVNLLSCPRLFSCSAFSLCFLNIFLNVDAWIFDGLFFIIKYV